MRRTLLPAVLLSGAGLLVAAPPVWWTQGTTALIDPSRSHATSENYQPANLGQLKNIAKKAKLHLDANLTGGAGPAIDTLVAGFANTNPATNYAPINLGQLKAVAKVFYDRLVAAGYNPKLSLASHGASGWASAYPWSPTTPTAENYAVANVGQLKWTFSFDVTDADSDGLPDWWEIQNGASSLATFGGDPAADSDHDGISDLEEYHAGTNPNDFWNGAPPVLTIVSGNNQGDVAGTTLAVPLKVQLSNSTGTISHNGTVVFTITSSSGGSLSPASPVSVNSAGLAQASLTLPSGSSVVGTAITVKAISSNSYGSSQVIFALSVGDPSVDPKAPGRPDIAEEHGSSVALVEWEDRSNNETAFYVDRSDDESATWIRRATLPANSLSYSDTGLVPDKLYTYRITSHNAASQ